MRPELERAEAAQFRNRPLEASRCAAATERSWSRYGEVGEVEVRHEAQSSGDRRRWDAGLWSMRDWRAGGNGRRPLRIGVAA
jgi:hypothetical protein